MIFQVEDMWNEWLEEIHSTRLSYYSDSNLDREAILPHVLYSETGMPVSRLINPENSTAGIMVHVRWNGLLKDDDTLEPLQNVYEHVPEMLLKLLNRKNIDGELRNQAKQQLNL